MFLDFIAIPRFTFLYVTTQYYFIYFQLFLSRWAKSYVFLFTLVYYALQDALIHFLAIVNTACIFLAIACQKKRLVRSTVNELLRGHKWPCQHQVLTLKFNFNEYVRSAQPLNGIHWCNLWAERAYCLQQLMQPYTTPYNSQQYNTTG